MCCGFRTSRGRDGDGARLVGDRVEVGVGLEPVIVGHDRPIGVCDLHKVLARKPRVFAVRALYGQAPLLDEGRMRCGFQRGVDARLHEFPQRGGHCESGEEHSACGNHHHDDDERGMQRQPREAALSCACVLFAFPFLPTFFAIASWARCLPPRRGDRHAFLLR